MRHPPIYGYAMVDIVRMMCWPSETKVISYTRRQAHIRVSEFRLGPSEPIGGNTRKHMSNTRLTAGEDQHAYNTDETVSGTWRHDRKDTTAALRDLGPITAGTVACEKPVEYRTRLA
jgi:hypothetical protein